MSGADARVVALDIGGTKLAAGIGASDGSITRCVDAPTQAGDGARRVLDRALTLARDCFEAELGADGTISAIGISTMGLTEATQVKLSPNVPGWQELHIPEVAADVFPQLPLAIANDVKLAARAEMTWGALAGVSDAIYLNLGTGIAAGIVSDGNLVMGAHEAAGEVGYTLRTGVPEPAMAADGATPLEEWFGGAGVARRLAAEPGPGSVAELVARQHEDPSARAFLDELWTGIAVLAANLCIAFDPAVLALGGGYVRSETGLLERVQEVVARAVPFPPKVVRAAFGADASLRGAAAAALEVIEVNP